MKKLNSIARRIFTSLGPRQSQSNTLPPQGSIGVNQLGHRAYVGGLWNEIGRLQFEFLKNQHLQPHHTFIDVACGSLRLGVHLIPYLNAGHYCGIEKEDALLKAGLEQELESGLAKLKKPHLICNDQFEFDRFGTRFHMGIAQSLFTHLPPDLILLCLKNIWPYMHDESVFFATYFETDSALLNPDKPHDHGYFAYTRNQMLDFGVQSGFKSDYIGDWNHPRGQVMVAYRRSITK